MDILLKLGNGTLYLGHAYWSHRCGPIGEWWLGDKPLRECEGEVIARGAGAMRMFEERRKSPA